MARFPLLGDIRDPDESLVPLSDDPDVRAARAEAGGTGKPSYGQTSLIGPPPPPAKEGPRALGVQEANMPSDSSGDQHESRIAATANQLEADIFGSMPYSGKARGPAPPEQDVLAAGHNKTIFGPGADQTIKDVFENRPKEIAKINEERSRVEAEKSTNLAKTHYQAKNLANQTAQELLANAKQNQAEHQARLQEYWNELTALSHEKIKEKSMWSNPGGILASIAAGMIGFASSDKTAGIKMIDNAIKQDLEIQAMNLQRRQDVLGKKAGILAEMVKLSGNYQEAIQAAYAMSWQAVQSQAAQITQAYRSQDAKLTGQQMNMMIAQQADMAKLQFMSGIATPPQVMPKQVIQKGLPPNYITPFDKEGQMGQTFGRTPPRPAPEPQAPQAGRWGVPMSMPPSPSGNNFKFEEGGNQWPDVSKLAQKAMVDKASKGSERLDRIGKNFKFLLGHEAEAEYNTAMHSVVSQFGLDRDLDPATRAKQEQKAMEYVAKQMDEGVKENKVWFDKEFGSIPANVADIRRDMKVIDQSFPGKGEKFWNSISGYLFGKESELTKDKAKEALGLEGRDLDKEEQKKLDEFVIKISSVRNNIYHAISGAAVSNQENARYKTMISTSDSWQTLKSQMDQISKDINFRVARNAPVKGLGGLMFRARLANVLVLAPGSIPAYRPSKRPDVDEGGGYGGFQP